MRKKGVSFVELLLAMTIFLIIALAIWMPDWAEEVADSKTAMAEEKVVVALEEALELDSCWVQDLGDESFKIKPKDRYMDGDISGTISGLKYLKESGYEVKLVFPNIVAGECQSLGVWAIKK